MSDQTLSVQLESKANLLTLINAICKKYNIDHSSSVNVINIKAFLAPLQVESILKKNKTLKEANEYIIKLYGDTIKANTISIPDDLNKTRKYLTKLIKTPGDDGKNLDKRYKGKFENKESFKESFDGPGSILDMNITERIETIKYLNYKSLFRDEYIFIDSRYQNTVNPDPSKILFTLLSNTKIKSDHGGIIVGGTIKDIVEMEIFPFTIPYKPIYANFYNKITLSINEWVNSSFEAYEGGQYHFCFDIERIDNNLIYLKPINSTYAFSRPVNYIDNFSLSFGAMLPKIAFDKDRAFPQSIDYTDEYGLFIFNEPHGIVTGDLVYITNFDTPNPARDVNIITQINRSEGHTIVKKDNFSFIINVDITSLHVEDPPFSGIFPIDTFEQNAIVYFASKRIQIQMRLRYLTSYPQ